MMVAGRPFFVGGGVFVGGRAKPVRFVFVGGRAKPVRFKVCILGRNWQMLRPYQMILLVRCKGIHHGLQVLVTATREVDDDDRVCGQRRGEFHDVRQRVR